MALAGIRPEEVNVLRDLDRLQEATVESGGKTWTVRTEATGAIPALMKVAGILAAPPRPSNLAASAGGCAATDLAEAPGRLRRSATRA